MPGLEFYVKEGHGGRDLRCPGFSLGAVSHRLYNFQMEVPFSKWKWPCLLKDEIPGLKGSWILNNLKWPSVEHGLTPPPLLVLIWTMVKQTDSIYDYHKQNHFGKTALIYNIYCLEILKYIEQIYCMIDLFHMFWSKSVIFLFNFSKEDFEASETVFHWHLKTIFFSFLKTLVIQGSYFYLVNTVQKP